MYTYKVKEGHFPVKFINAQGVQVSTSDKDERIIQPATSQRAEFERVIPKATQEDLKFAYEKLGLSKFIQRIEVHPKAGGAAEADDKNKGK